jgi:hypothetical protein
MDNNIWSFGNNHLYTAWTTDNCYKCYKYVSDDDTTCEINLDLIAAYITNGKVSDPIATRMGWVDKAPYSSVCSEIDLKRVS